MRIFDFWSWCIAAAMLMIAFSTTSLRAQSDDDAHEKMRRMFVSSAEEFSLSGGPGGRETFELVRPRPVLNWSNPERRTHAGAMFLWARNGRPQAAMCMYPKSEQVFDLEFQSLSLYPLTATAGGDSAWEPGEAGIEYRKVTGTKPPGTSIPIRLRQMRNLARAFSAKLVPPQRTEIPLRLMSAPSYRYPPPDPSSNLIDGSVFTFVQGTDPEVLLVIEAITDASGVAGWQYALARMSMVPMQVSYKKELVWEHPDWAPTRQQNGPYYVIPKFGLDQ